MEKYDETLWSYLREPSHKGDIRNFSLRCRCVIASLNELHKRGYIFGDLKASNILLRGPQAYLSDFGLFNQEGNLIRYMGIASYMAPETFLVPGPKFSNRKMDMFSFGILLLNGIFPDLFLQWEKTTLDLQDHFKQQQDDLDVQKSGLLELQELAAKSEHSSYLQRLFELKQEGITRESFEQFNRFRLNYKQAHAALQKTLVLKGDPMSLLISNLIEYDPANRPTCQEAKDRFETCLDT